MINRTILSAILFVALFAAGVSSVLRMTPDADRTAACAQTVVYVPFVLQSSGYTPTEAALRETAKRGYVVGKPRYARAVHGLARGRYAERW